ncbi:MAG: LysR family transcriptional regulator [Bradyrhizobium sp.]|nr:LysR family transcriptional regulator [Bradyrhizobium sp.]
MQQSVLAPSISIFSDCRLSFGIAERGSFRRTALHLNLSRTAISQRIRKLEDKLGVKQPRPWLDAAALVFSPKNARNADEPHYARRHDRTEPQRPARNGVRLAPDGGPLIPDHDQNLRQQPDWSLLRASAALPTAAAAAGLPC